MSIIRLRDMMAACNHINTLIKYPGCKQICDDELISTISDNTEDKILLVLGMFDREIQMCRRGIIYAFERNLVLTSPYEIVLQNKLRVRFIHIGNPNAIYGFQPDYVYII